MSVELVYFDGRGRAEILRMLMTVADIQYTEVDLMTRESYLSLKPELMFEQAPLLRMDGMNLVQTGAIARYLARKAHLLGDTDVDCAKIDMMYEGTRDFLRMLICLGFYPDQDEATKAEVKAKGFPRYFPAFNNVLAESKSGYLVGGKLSLADLAVFEILLLVVDFFTDEPMKDYPHLKEFYVKMKSHEKIIKYMKDVRKPKADEKLAATVRVILSHLDL